MTPFPAMPDTVLTCDVCGGPDAVMVHYEGRNLCPGCNVWPKVLGDKYTTTEEFEGQLPTLEDSDDERIDSD